MNWLNSAEIFVFQVRKGVDVGYCGALLAFPFLLLYLALSTDVKTDKVEFRVWVSQVHVDIELYFALVVNKDFEVSELVVRQGSESAFRSKLNIQILLKQYMVAYQIQKFNKNQ